MLRAMQATLANATVNQTRPGKTGRWVTAKTYADHFGLSWQTLANWRYQDGLAGRDEAREGFPQYRRFGRACRYWLDES